VKRQKNLSKKRRPKKKPYKD